MKAIVINLDARKDRMASFNMNKFPFEVERFSAFNNKIGEDGCTQSHLSVLHNQTEFPFVVFEDDCVMIQPWKTVEKAISQLPPNWDALWLGANPRRPLTKYSENLYRINNAYCLHAVIYNSKRIVDYIYNKHNTPSGKNLDIFIANDVMQKFNCYAVYPMCATQLSDQSDIAKVFTRNRTEILENFKKMTR